MRSSRFVHAPALGALLGILVLGTAPTPAGAAPFPFSDPTSFGTAVNTGSFTVPTLTAADNGNGFSEITGPGLLTGADLNGDVPQIDLFVNDLVGEGKTIGTPGVEAYSLLADGITVSGTATGAAIPTSISVSGNMIVSPGTNEIANLTVKIWDYASFAAGKGPLAELDVANVLAIDSLAFRECQGGVCGAYAAWTGSATLNTSLTAANLGFVIEAFGQAEGDGMNFSGTIETTLAPPPGDTVTLASGQVFTPAVSVPDPSSLLLVAGGLLGVGVMRRRRRK